MTKYQRLFIIGHPGAGKALVAKNIAEQLGWRFIDADFGLEQRFGRTIAGIMGKKGAESFYNSQNEVLRSLLNKEKVVITTDPSVVESENNRKLLASEFVVFVQVNTSVQLERSTRSAPPFLLEKGLESFYNQRHLERDMLYQDLAIISVNSDDNALEKHVAQILSVFPVSDLGNPLDLDKQELILFHKSEHVPVQLTPSKARCLKYLAQGKSAKEIAREMDISYRTVEDYIAKTMELLGCSSSKELIALYHDQP